MNHTYRIPPKIPNITYLYAAYTPSYLNFFALLIVYTYKKTKKISETLYNILVLVNTN